MNDVRRMGLTAEQRQRFNDRGLVKIPRAIAPPVAEAMADALWRELARRHQIQRREPGTWRIERPTDFKDFLRSGAFKAMASPEVCALLDDLLGRDQWAQPVAWGQPLVCFPGNCGRWDVPHQNWHLDLPANPKRFSHMMGRMFAILAPLERKGGGSVVAAGSHRLIQALADEDGVQLSSSEMRQHLKGEHGWFADLMSPTREFDRVARFIDAPSMVGGVPVQVEEMTGEPGDVWLMHPAALHAPAPNVLGAPRLVLAQFVYPRTTSARRGPRPPAR